MKFSRMLPKASALSSPSNSAGVLVMPKTKDQLLVLMPDHDDDGLTALRSTVWLKNRGAASSLARNRDQRLTRINLVHMQVACRTSSTTTAKKMFQIQIASLMAYDVPWKTA